MSFTIKCDKCGDEAVFTSKSKKWGNGIELDIDISGFSGNQIRSIDIHCENMDCPNYIEVKY